MNSIIEVKNVTFEYSDGDRQKTVATVSLEPSSLRINTTFQSDECAGSQSE